MSALRSREKRVIDYGRRELLGRFEGAGDRGLLILFGLGLIPTVLANAVCLTDALGLFGVLLFVFPCLALGLLSLLSTLVWGVLVLARSKRRPAHIGNVVAICAIQVLGLVSATYLVSRHGGGAPGGF